MAQVCVLVRVYCLEQEWVGLTCQAQPSTTFSSSMLAEGPGNLAFALVEPLRRPLSQDRSDCGCFCDIEVGRRLRPWSWVLMSQVSPCKDLCPHYDAPCPCKQGCSLPCTLTPCFSPSRTSMQRCQASSQRKRRRNFWTGSTENTNIHHRLTVRFCRAQ